MKSILVSEELSPQAKLRILDIVTQIRCLDDFIEPHFSWKPESIEEEFERSNWFLAFAAENTTELLGFICYRSLGSEIEIMNLAVAPKTRRQGVMSLLIQHFKNKFGKNGVSILLEVHEGNTSAISLYLKNSFTILGRRKSYYRDGGAAILMGIDIKNS